MHFLLNICIFDFFLVSLQRIYMESERMISPFILPPHPAAQAAAAEVTARVHAYMDAHSESELHRQGKMFGVLIYKQPPPNLSLKGGEEIYSTQYIAAFSAQLDGSYYHEGFVPPAVAMNNEPLTTNIQPVGHSKEESQRLQRLLFAQYNFVNRKGETRNLLDIFAHEKPILPENEWFGERLKDDKAYRLPPSGAGECCAPKLLQYAYTHGLKPFALAEFWVGAPSRTEIRQEGTFYAPCSGRCVPILRWMLGEEEMVNDQWSLDNENLPLEIIYEDAYLIVVNKPSGMLSVPGKGEELSIESYLRFKIANGKYIKAVHRLDQDTSGLLVLAKTQEAYKTLQAYFQRRDILKRYEAVVKPNDINGHWSLENGEISLPLLPNPYDRPRQMVNEAHGKPAITRYKVRERRADGTALVDFFPQTGRTHQLRVHAAHPDGLNAPIVGDRLYNGDWLLRNGKNKVDRLMLHAAEIRFVHPITKKEMHFCIPSGF